MKNRTKRDWVTTIFDDLEKLHMKELSLETIDLQLLRQLLHAPKGTSNEMLFLELGVKPFRDIIRERRLGFLYYILNEEPKSMINKFFQIQMKNRTKRDWATTILDDLEKLDMKELSLETIKTMKKVSFMNIVKRKINERSFENLIKVKNSHSKVKQLEYTCLKIQKYLQPNRTEIKREEAQLIFRLRCRVTEAKVNLRGKYDNLECGACGLEEENQQHILDCKMLNGSKIQEELKYINLLTGTVTEKLKLAKRFKENFAILEKIKKEKT